MVNSLYLSMVNSNVCLKFSFRGKTFFTNHALQGLVSISKYFTFHVMDISGVFLQQNKSTIALNCHFLFYLWFCEPLTRCRNAQTKGLSFCCVSTCTMMTTEIVAGRCNRKDLQCYYNYNTTFTNNNNTTDKCVLTANCCSYIYVSFSERISNLDLRVKGERSGTGSAHKHLFCAMSREVTLQHLTRCEALGAVRTLKLSTFRHRVFRQAVTHHVAFLHTQQHQIAHSLLRSNKLSGLFLILPFKFFFLNWHEQSFHSIKILFLYFDSESDVDWYQCTEYYWLKIAAGEFSKTFCF